jgi:hypothetical protein
MGQDQSYGSSPVLPHVPEGGIGMSNAVRGLTARPRTLGWTEPTDYERPLPFSGRADQALQACRQQHRVCDQHSRESLPILSRRERRSRQSENGEFIYLCLGDDARSQLREINAKNLETDAALAAKLYELCIERWGWFVRLLTMSTFDRVLLKEVRYPADECRFPSPTWN